MSFDADEEILQDFLVEVGEILEKLSEQLVDLENNGEDIELLNAIFRGFHTIKGGAGFLQLETLVELCHVAENVFDLLRNGGLSVTPELMDVVLHALDSVQAMFAVVSDRQEPERADPALLNALQALVDNKGQAPKNQPNTDVSESQPESSVVEKGLEQTKNDSDDELFDIPAGDTAVDLFDELDEPDVTDTKNNEDEITEEEFSALLDELHGKDGSPGKLSESDTKEKKEDIKTDINKKSVAEIVNSSESEITDEEFELLLDSLHGVAPVTDKEVNKYEKITVEEKSTAQLIESKQDKKSDSNKNQIEDILKDLNASVTLEEKDKKEPEKSEIKSKTDSTDIDQKNMLGKGTQAVGKKNDTKMAPTAKKQTAKETAFSAEATVRVDTKRLDDIMNMVGELVLVRNRLVRLGLNTSDEIMAKAVANLDVVTADLQASVMKTRMQPIKKVFGRFPRVVRDLARNLKKEVNLELQGEDTDLDKNLVEALADPLVHLVRNAVDHGIESPTTREANGKPRVGNVVLAAQQEGDHIVLSISDDGGGMDPEVLRKKSVEKGLMDDESAARLSDHEIYNLIFHPGFSTCDKISDVSGRGVGMDVVKTKITQLNGTIDVQSEKGKGSVIAIKVPLTLAIMPTLMVMLGNQTFALPLVNVNEIFHIDLTRTNEIDGQEVVVVRDKALPLFHLKRWLVCSASQQTAKDGHVVVVSVGTQKVGFVVDQLIGQEEVVIKPLGKMLHGTAGMAGATITGDGRIALILDAPNMLKHYAGDL